MNFRDMLIMAGPAGVPCDHSVIDVVSGRAKNNHWLKSSKGVLVARGSEYTSAYEVGSLIDYKNGLEPPQLLTMDEDHNISQLKVNDEMISDNWVVTTP